MVGLVVEEGLLLGSTEGSIDVDGESLICRVGLLDEDGIIVGSSLGCTLTVGAAVVGTGSANGASTHVKLFADNNT